MAEALSSQTLYAVAPQPVEKRHNPTRVSHQWLERALTIASIGGSTVGSILFLSGNAELAGLVGKVGLGAFVTRMLSGLLRGESKKNE